jgi:hypothetical protein
VKTISLTVTRFGCSLTVTTTVQVNICPDPLIVTFDNIGAQVNGNAIELEWGASGFEAENTVFIVQRSEDGQAFRNLSAVSGSDRAADGRFHFLDETPGFGENTYRVEFRQSGPHTAQGISPTAMAMYMPEGVRNIHVYPNPTTDRLTVQFVKQSSNPIRFSVSDAYGRVRLESVVPAHAERVEVDMSRMATGVYYLHFQSDLVLEQVIRVVKGE